MYSQNLEEQFITEYFGDFKGSLLSIGENDGQMLSNAKKLIELGWTAVLVEPSPKAFAKLSHLHIDNPNVTCVNVAIGTVYGKMTLHESGNHYADNSDIALLSSLREEETIRWKKAGVKFEKCEVDVIPYDQILIDTSYVAFDFITIDAEGMDWDILQQIDLSHTKLICIEWNGNQIMKLLFIKYCSGFGLSELIYESGENLIIGRGMQTLEQRKYEIAHNAVMANEELAKGDLNFSDDINELKKELND